MRTIVAMMLASAWPAAGQGIARGPYMVAASSTSAQICWRFQSSDDCHVFEALSPGATFTYAFGGSSQVWTAQTLPMPSQTLTFAAFGELGPDPAQSRRLAGVLRDSGAQLVVLIGNAAYPSGEDKSYDAQYFQPFAEPLTRIPFYSAAGYTDYGDYFTVKRSAQRFQEVYSRIQHKPAYYSFDAGPAHFAVLDTNSALYVQAAPPLEAGSAERRWLEDDLSRAQARWKIVVVPVPLYSTMRYNGQHGFLRHVLEPVFQKYRVDLVLQGNDRIYERSRPVGGIVYVTAGTGGAKLDVKQQLKPDWLEKRIASFGLVRSRVDEQELRLDFLDDNGAVLDTASWKKPPQ